MRFLIACALLMLCGCATVPSDPADVFEIADQAQYTADLATCRTHLAEHQARKHISVGPVISGAAQGAGQNLSSAAINPVIPALGAAGAASSVLYAQLDPLGTSAQKFLNDCVKQKTERDHSALVIETE